MENKNLIKEVESLVLEVEKTHRYSMSRIYGAYNEVFGKDEQPQACASCLIRKMKDLKKWLDGIEPIQATQAVKSAPKARAKKVATKAPRGEKKITRTYRPAYV